MVALHHVVAAGRVEVDDLAEESPAAEGLAVERVDR